MPIVYDKEAQGFKVIDTTPEEEEALINLGMQYVIAKIGIAAVQETMAEAIKEQGLEETDEKGSVH
jgi:hypothetical protein